LAPFFLIQTSKAIRPPGTPIAGLAFFFLGQSGDWRFEGQLTHPRLTAK
jgi:hypothetical protein